MFQHQEREQVHEQLRGARASVGTPAANATVTPVSCGLSRSLSY